MVTEDFSFSIELNSRQIDLQAQLRKTAYNWKIAVLLDGNEIIFEPDDEGNLRAVIVDETVSKKIDSSLVKAIGEVLEEGLK